MTQSKGRRIRTLLIIAEILSTSGREYRVCLTRTKLLLIFNWFHIEKKYVLFQYYMYQPYYIHSPDHIRDKN